MSKIEDFGVHANQYYALEVRAVPLYCLQLSQYSAHAAHNLVDCTPP